MEHAAAAASASGQQDAALEGWQKQLAIALRGFFL